MRDSRFPRIVIMLLLLPAVCAAQECVDYRDFEQPRAWQELSGESCPGLTLFGDFALVADADDGLQVVDVGAPMAPSLVTTVPVGQAIDVEVCAGTAYVSTADAGLVMVDLADPEAPLQVGAVAGFDEARYLARHGDWLFVTADDSLFVLDAGAAAAPVVVGSHGIAEYDRIKVQDDWLYILGADWSRVAVDELTNPTAPAGKSAAVLPPPDPTYRYLALAADGDYVITSGTLSGYDTGGYYFEESSLIAWDLSGDDAVRIGEIGGSGGNDMLIVGGRLLCGNGTFYDIDPAGLLTSAGRVQLDVHGSEYRRLGDWIYLAGSNGTSGGLQILPVDDLRDMVVALAGVESVFASDYDVMGDRAFAATSAGLEVIDVSDPAAPVEIRVVGNETGYRGVSVSGDRGCLYYGSVTWRADLTDPDEPLITGSLDLEPDRPSSVTSAGGIAYVACRAGLFNEEGSLHCLDLDDGAAPVDLGRLDLPDPIMAMQLHGSLLYLVCQNRASLLVVDVAAPAEPTIVADVVIPETGFYPSLALVGDLLLLGNHYSLMCWSIADATAPLPLGQTTFPSRVWSVGAAGSAAYLRLYNGTSIRVIDIMEPTAPVELSPIQVDERLEDVLVSGGVVFVNSRAWLHMAWPQCDDSTPVTLTFFTATPHGTSVRLRWSVSGPVDDFRVTARSEGRQWRPVWEPADDDAFEAVDDSPLLRPGATVTYELGIGDGPVLQSIDVVIPAPPVRAAIRSAAPNPFNPRLEVVFSLPRPGHARLCIYDAAGHRVAVVADGHFAAAEHRCEWNGLDLHGRAAASGTYFLRLESGSITEHRKVVLVR